MATDFEALTMQQAVAAGLDLNKGNRWMDTG